MATQESDQGANAKSKLKVIVRCGEIATGQGFSNLRWIDEMDPEQAKKAARILGDFSDQVTKFILSK